MKNMNPLIHLKKATPSFVAPFVQKRRTTVKRIFSLLFVLAVVVTTTSSVYAQCSNATLTGSYGFKEQGFGTRNSKPAKLGNTIPFATVGVVTFDGAGNASFTLTQVFNSSGGIFSLSYNPNFNKTKQYFMACFPQPMVPSLIKRYLKSFVKVCGKHLRAAHPLQ